MFQTKFVNKSDEQEAKKSLSSVREKCAQLGVDIKKFMWDHNSEKAEKINLRSFKKAIFELKCLTLYNIENLARYMDNDNEGFISIGNFVAQVNNSTMFADSFARTSPKREKLSSTAHSKSHLKGEDRNRYTTKWTTQK